MQSRPWDLKGSTSDVLSYSKIKHTCTSYWTFSLGKLQLFCWLTLLFDFNVLTLSFSCVLCSVRSVVFGLSNIDDAFTICLTDTLEGSFSSCRMNFTTYLCSSPGWFPHNTFLSGQLLWSETELCWGEIKTMSTSAHSRRGKNSRIEKQNQQKINWNLNS